LAEWIYFVASFNQLITSSHYLLLSLFVLLQFNGTLAFYGLVFAAYSLAHFLACLAFGWMADRRPIKELLAAVRLYMVDECG
jgi:MFS family permease